MAQTEQPVPCGCVVSVPAVIIPSATRLVVPVVDAGVMPHLGKGILVLCPLHGAAPDLLVALREARYYVGACAGEMGPGREMLVRVDAALARATEGGD